MKLTICEEFPTPENLSRLSHLDFPLTLTIAAQNLQEFHEKVAQARQYGSPQEIGYWPTLAKEEGYWPSPLCNKQALERIISELTNRPQKDELLLMWDAEPPFLNPKLFLNQREFPSNKRMINQFLKSHNDYNLRLKITEDPTFMIPEFLQRKMGIAFDPEEYDAEKIKMTYTSIMKAAYRFLGKNVVNKTTDYLLRREVRNGVRNYRDRFSVGLGCIGTGIVGKLDGSSAQMTPEELEHDLQIAKENHAANAFIFRLGGLDKNYAAVLKKFAS